MWPVASVLSLIGLRLGRVRRPVAGFLGTRLTARAITAWRSDLTQALEQISDAFGPPRMFWGTDITRMPCSWRQCVTMFTEELPWLKRRDLELVMGRVLCDWIGWKLPG